ncbi:MAG: branched-chain amino acid transaminase [Candidatus Hadarchaeales archaeon]
MKKTPSLTPVRFIWMDGQLVAWEKAQIHVLTHTLHYGFGVFEGIRCYNTSRGAAVFRLTDHMKRLENSASLVGMKLPYTPEELVRATKDLIRANELNECYIRPIAFYGYGVMGLNPEGAPVQVAIAVWPWGTYLGEEGLREGVRVKISGWRRIDPRTLPPQAKLVANYANSILAKVEALKEGFQEAILLNTEGKVAEGPGENLFIVKGGRLLTPPISAGVLPGITRDSVMRIAADEGIPVEERNLTVEEVMQADEAFFTGTAAEVTPIREIEGRRIGTGEWKITRRIQKIYFDTVRGRVEKYLSWLEFV